MLRSTEFENELIGSIEDINISDIFQSLTPLRNATNNILELADSISKIGLLSPILVRITEAGRFEVVAGNRRFNACKSLGWKKIPCHIVELDDRSAFEASIIENIQRSTLNIIEEGLAFRKYVNEFGWGAASELAHKLSKSPSYISKRMRLLELPDDVLQLLTESEMSVTAGEELLSLKERDKQSKFARIAVKKSMSSKALRKFIKDDKCHMEDFTSFSYLDTSDEKEKYLKTFDKSIISLRMALNGFATLLERTEDNWLLYEILMNHKNRIHSQIDVLIREKKKFANRSHFFQMNSLHLNKDSKKSKEN